MQAIKYPKTPQLHQAVRNLSDRVRYFKGEDGLAAYDPTIELPTLTFTGTVKLHGTNAGVGWDAVNGFWAQSRNRVITPDDDNAGFAKWTYDHDEELVAYIQSLSDYHGIHTDRYSVVVYGEWCGGNIQKGVAVTGLPLMFVVFAARAVRIGDPEHADSVWLQESGNYIVPEGMYFSRDFPHRHLDIDMNNPPTNLLLEYTHMVEQECPVGAAFDVQGVGEGIVWTALHEGELVSFKVKGDKHTTSHVKKLKAVDPARTAAIEEFVYNHACTPDRLEQAFTEVMDTMNGGVGDVKKTGDFLKWVVQDALSEEQDKLDELGLDGRCTNKVISQVARKWLFEQL